MSEKKTSNFTTTLKEKIINHKKSGLCAVGLIVVIILLAFVWAHNCPSDNILSKIKLPWKSNSRQVSDDDWPKPKRARPKGGGRRSDSAPGGDVSSGKNKKEFIKSVAHFNKVAATPCK
jgi:hypothetical protein